MRENCWLKSSGREMWGGGGRGRKKAVRDLLGQRGEGEGGAGGGGAGPADRPHQPPPRPVQPHCSLHLLQSRYRLATLTSTLTVLK